MRAWWVVAVVASIGSGCAPPTVMVPLQPARFASTADLEQAKEVATLRCKAVGMNAMGPPPVTIQQHNTAVAVASTTVNVHPAGRRGIDTSLMNPPVEQEYPSTPAPSFAESLAEGERHQRKRANYLACMAEAGFVERPAP